MRHSRPLAGNLLSCDRPTLAARAVLLAFSVAIGNPS